MPLLSPEDSEMESAGTQNNKWLSSLLAPLSPLFRWWLGELKEMLPTRLHRLFSERRLLVRASQREICIADPQSADSQEVCHALRSWGVSAESKALSRATLRCDLVLERAMVLERELELPMDAESSLRRVLSFSMDRYTPFQESDVLFDYKITRRDSTGRKINLTLYVVPRESLKPVIANLAEMGIEVAAMDVGAEGETARAGINLVSAERRVAGSGFSRIERFLTVAAMLLALVALMSPFIMRQQAVTKLENEVSQLRGELRQAEADSSQLTERADRMRQIQGRSRAMPAMLDVLLELTRLMPDEAWAGQVSIKSGRVRLTGEASAASELLTRLSSSSIFSDPKFEAPLTQNPRTERERFVISLAIKGANDGA